MTYSPLTLTGHGEVGEIEDEGAKGQLPNWAVGVEGVSNVKEPIADS